MIGNIEFNLLMVLDTQIITVILWYLRKKINKFLCTKKISIGKIKFNTDNIIGKECEETIFKGKFENRPVAVKRLSPEYFKTGKNEVRILLESDYHPNVVRYYCTEQDKKFRYIAFELYAATIQGYVENGQLNDEISPKDIFSQSIKGLQHLHSLGIVHRNIKPQNVLLSIPSRRHGSFNSVRVLISDFGLGKMLKGNSLGVIETDGWIKHEKFAGSTSINKSIDIFSMGCLFYYVLSNGKHPFGESFTREARISDQQEAPCLDELNDNELWKRLIAVMISGDPDERPPASAISHYPAFWENSTLLSFLQAVFDCVDNIHPMSSVMRELEKGGDGVFGDDGWLNKIDQNLTSELVIFRTYRPDSIRDLLRAFHSNKPYFRELPVDIQKLLGNTPDTILEYWTTKFPLLVYHTWTAMQCVANDISFVQYFTEDYYFPRTEFLNVPSWINEEGFKFNILQVYSR